MITHRFYCTAYFAHAVLGGIVLGLAGCNAFNPAFLSLVAPEAAADFATLPNAPGYVVMALQDNVQIDGQLLDYLTSKLQLSEAQQQGLRARIRMRLRITHADGTFQTVEMIDGSSDFVDPDFDDEAVPDLSQNSLTNLVVRCDVASVQLEPGTGIEVFIPVPLQGFQLVEIQVGDTTTTEFQIRTTRPPQFQTLQVDDTDDDGNVILRRNIDVRDVLSPTANVVCGSVVAIIVDGVLAVPFLPRASTSDPSFDLDDENTVAGIGGRYEIRVSVQ